MDVGALTYAGARTERSARVGCFFGNAPGILEVYRNPERPYLDLTTLDPATIHLAFSSDNVAADMDRLIAAGATHIEGQPDAQGYGLIMLRSPHGMPLQLCRRQQAVDGSTSP